MTEKITSHLKKLALLLISETVKPLIIQFGSIGILLSGLVFAWSFLSKHLSTMLRTPPMAWKATETLFCIAIYLLLLVPYFLFVYFLYKNRSANSKIKAEHRNLLSIVPSNARCVWHKFKNKDISYISLIGEVIITNLSDSIRVVITNSTVKGYSASGILHFPVDYPSDIMFIEKRTVQTVKFNYTLKECSHKLKPILKFSLIFKDQFGGTYETPKLNFYETQPISV